MTRHGTCTACGYLISQEGDCPCTKPELVSAEDHAILAAKRGMAYGEQAQETATYWRSEHGARVRERDEARRENVLLTKEVARLTALARGLQAERDRLIIQIGGT